MNIKNLEKNEQLRLEWALENAEKKEKLPEPHGKGLVYTTTFRHGRVELNAYQALDVDGVIDDAEIKPKHRKVEGIIMHETREGRKLLNASQTPVWVKDRIHHRVAMYV